MNIPPSHKEADPDVKKVRIRERFMREFGIDPNAVYTVVVLNANEDVRGTDLWRGPDLGVIITCPDGSQVAHGISAHDAAVKVGDQVSFFVETDPYAGLTPGERFAAQVHALLERK